MKTIIISGTDNNYYYYLNFLCSFHKLNNILTLCDLGIMNTSFFAFKNKSTIWDEWANTYGKIIKKNQEEYCLSMDQSSLNLVLYNCLEKVNFLNSKFNWLNKNLLPIIKNNRLCKPLYPHKKIEILQSTSFDINKSKYFREFEKQNNINISLVNMFKNLHKF
jgi:hypothetical protein